MNVLSLCDGMSCGQIALNNIGVKVDSYYASEIEKSSIMVTQTNFPNTIQIGDMTNIDEEFLKTLPRIDLVLSGTPCRDVSKATTKNGSPNWKKMHEIGTGLEGKHSRLFYNFVDILKWIKENNNKDVKFLFENVDMKDNDRDEISSLLEVEPTLIDSADFSAQNRRRYYWTNIAIPKIKIKCNKVLKDIILPASEVEDKYWYNDREFIFHGEDKSVCATLVMKGHDMIKRVTSQNFKSPTLTSCRGGNLQKKVYQNGKCRKLTPLEYERLQTAPEGYTSCVSNSQRYNMLGDGWTINVISHILKGMKIN